jgi:hemolysin activation/secretion protein
MTCKTISPYLVLPFLVSAMAAKAQNTAIPVDAGSLRQQIEQTREFNLPQAVRPQPALAPPLQKSKEGATIKARAFVFQGNTLLSSEVLAAALSGFVNRELSFESLQSAADAVGAAYRQAGYVVRAYLPEQDITDQVVKIQVIEARFAGVRTEGEPSKLVAPAQIQAFINSAQTVGKILRADDMDRALLLLDDLPGVSVAGTLAPGQSDGETLLVLQTTDEPFVYGSVGIDNSGSLSTGTNRLTANLNVNSPGGRGELFNVSAMVTEGINFGRVSLTVPDRHDGLRLGASLSSMQFKVLQTSVASAQVKGTSATMGVDLSYPVLRSRMQNVYWTAGVDNKTFFTEDSVVRSDYASYAIRTGLSGNRFDDLGGGGANSASVQMLWGKLADMRQHSALSTINPNFNKLNVSLSRQQTLTPSHSLLVSMQTQHATKVLDSSERFFVGGSQSVRAYGPSEMGGDRGQMMSTEWRWRLDRMLVLTAFVDQSRVVQLPLTGSDQKTTMSLYGRGLSADWQAPMGIATKFTWSRRNGRNPQANINTGNDSDGTLKINRYWVSATMSF